MNEIKLEEMFAEITEKLDRDALYDCMQVIDGKLVFDECGIGKIVVKMLTEYLQEHYYNTN